MQILQLIKATIEAFTEQFCNFIIFWPTVISNKETILISDTAGELTMVSLIGTVRVR